MSSYKNLYKKESSAINALKKGKNFTSTTFNLLRNSKSVALCAIDIDGQSFRYLCKEIQSDPDVISCAIAKIGNDEVSNILNNTDEFKYFQLLNVFDFDEIQKDIEKYELQKNRRANKTPIYYDLKTSNKCSTHNVPDRFAGHYDKTINFIRLNGMLYLNKNNYFKSDKNIFKAAVLNTPWIIQHIPKHLKTDKELYLEIVSFYLQNSKILQKHSMKIGDFIRFFSNKIHIS